MFDEAKFLHDLGRFLGHLVSWFTCNTWMIVDASSRPPVSHVI